MGKIPCITELPTSYQVRIFYRENGKEKCYSKTFKYKNYSTKEQALKAAKRHRNKKHKELQGKKKTFTVDELYKKSYKYIPVTKATQKRHGNFYTYAIGEKYGQRNINDITEKDIEESLQKITNKSNDCIERALGVWKRIYKTGSMVGMSITDKTTNIIPPKSQNCEAKEKTTALTKKELEKAINILAPKKTIKDEKYKYEHERIVCMIWLIYFTKMKPSEILALAKENVDIEKCVIKVKVEQGSSEKKNVVIMPITLQKRRREIEMSEKVLAICEYLLATRRNEYLFCRYSGELWDINKMCDTIYQATKKESFRFTLTAVLGVK